jgi:hypothetical protein
VARPFASVLLPVAVATGAGSVTAHALASLPGLVTLVATGLVLIGVYAVMVRWLLPRPLADMLQVLPVRVSARLAWLRPRGVAAELP